MKSNLVRRSGPGSLSAAAIGLLLLTGARAGSAATITVDASKQTAGNPHFWSATVGTGKAKLTLRSDLQTHYKIANRELGMQRVRGHGVLNDEMGLYKAAGSYDWKNLDTYLAAIVAAGMRPIMELDFMPTALGTSGDKTPPKDYNEWKSFIKALAQHCVDKYGMDDVKTWYWEVWNEPDYDGFWTGTDMDKYYTLYDNTVDALVSVIPNVLVGGPATTEPGKIKAFLQHCKSANKRVTFASSHVYPGGASTGAAADAAGLVNDNNTRISGITGAGYTTADVKSFNTEWNSSYNGQGGLSGDVVTSMDNHWNVGFILKGIKLLSDKNSGDTPAAEVFSYWALSDVFDESSGPDGSYIAGKNSGNLPFGQVFGMMTYQGVRKAAFNAFKMLNYLGPKRLSSSGGTGSDGVDAMATIAAAGDEVQILVYNYYKTMKTTGSDSVTVSVSNLPSALAGKEIFVTQFLVDQTHSNPYSVWEGQTKPGSPSEAQWQEMRAAQHLALFPSTQVGAKKTVDTSFSTTFTLNRQAGTLIILGVKRPLTGRDALVEIEAEDYDGQSTATKKDSGDSTLGQAISASSGSYVYFENVDYTDGGVNAVQLRVKTAGDTSLELHAGSQTGALLGKCTVSSTSNAWATQTCTLGQTATGVAKLYVVFGGAIELNWLKFQAGGSVPGTGGAPGSGGSTGVGGVGGGAGGSGGVPNGGAGGSAGAAGSTGRDAGNGGSGGTASGGAGGSASGGAAGSNSGGVGGSANGGSAGSSSGGAAGSAGSGGNASGGSSGGASGGSGGSASGGSGGGSGGSGAGNGGASGAGGSSTTTTGAAAGCTCRVGAAREPSWALLIGGLLLAVVGLRGRRARRSM